MKRANNRADNQLRPLTITYDIFEYASGSVLLELGKTKVLCAVTLSNKVPPFLKGKKIGWLTAEYAMLPASTHTRVERDATSSTRNGRSVEISRLIGRVFRSILNLNGIGERTIIIDCDVLQADGSTRTACITGAYLALQQAVTRWLANHVINENIITEPIAAVSVGIANNGALLDIDFAEDSIIGADFNIVMTQAGSLVEIQGCAERKPLSSAEFDQIMVLARKGIADIFEAVQQPVAERKPKSPFNKIRLLV